MYAECGRSVSKLTSENLRSFAGATEILCIEESARGHILANEISEKLHRFSVIKATSPLDHKSVWIEIFSPGVSKSSAVRWLAEKLFLSNKEVCGIGNDFNDQDMLQWVGTAYVVENSPASLRSDFATVPSNNNGGVSAAIEDWLNK